MIDEKVYGEIIGPMGAYLTLVAYTAGGIDFEVFVENDDFVTMEDLLDNDNY